MSRHAAMRANVLTLPSAPIASTSLEVIDGRQRLVRHGVFLHVVSGKLRTCYAQIDGETILADECKCSVVWLPWSMESANFAVVRELKCPIDEHRIAALNQLQESES